MSDQEYDDVDEPRAKKPKRVIKAVKKDELIFEAEKKTMKWTIEEKTKLVEAIKKYGLGNLDILAIEVGTKTACEIRFLCSFRRRQIRHEMNRRDKENELNSSWVKENPIQKWLDKIRSAINPKNRTLDYTCCLTEIMLAAAKEEPDLGPKIPNFASLYNYLATILGGSVPPRLSPSENLIMMHLFPYLSNALVENEFVEEKELLQNLLKRKTVIPDPSVQVPTIEQFNEYREKRRQAAVDKRKMAEGLIKKGHTEMLEKVEVELQNFDVEESEETDYEKYPKMYCNNHEGTSTHCKFPLKC